jgi:phosphatidylglycerophosphate synthase
MWSDVAAIYRASLKRKDVNWFTTWIARPPAAVVVYALRGTRITPNQVTFLATVVAAAAAAVLVAWPGWLGLGVAIALYELSFVLDCADGMLARYRKIASPIGHLLDFLMDELKAQLIYGCVAVRLWRESGDDRLLLVGLAGLFALAAGISLTTFTRRSEYTGGAPKVEDVEAAAPRRRSPAGMVIGAIEWAARVVVHYPQYIWICAVVNRIDLYFWAYGAVNVLYLGLTFLKILRKLGGFAPSVGTGVAGAPPAPGASGAHEATVAPTRSTGGEP